MAVLGMHRSGTSAIAQLLQELGFDAGPEAELMPSHPVDNPRGFYERWDIQGINDAVLNELGGEWWRPPATAPGWEQGAGLEPLRAEARRTLATFGVRPWVVKDPRFSLTLPFWRELAGPMRYVVCVRDPGEVTDSLVHRFREADPGSPAASVEAGEWVTVWLQYVDAALRHTAGEPRIVIDHRRLMEDPAGEVHRLAAFLGVGVDEARARAVGRLIEPDLWRQRPNGGGDARLAAARARYDAACRVALADRYEQELGEVRAALVRSEQTVAQMRATRAWRLACRWWRVRERLRARR